MKVFTAMGLSLGSREGVAGVSRGCRKGVLLESMALGKPTIKEELKEEVYGGLSADLTRRRPIGQAN